MKHASIHRPFILLVLVALLAAGCGHREKPAATSSGSGAAATTGASQPAPAVPATSESVTIMDANGRRAMVIGIGPQDATVELGEASTSQMIVGRLRESGKRKYELQGGRALAEVKPEDDAFKLRTPDGRLLWKVKFKEGKVKISDNEENQHPYELKDDGDHVKVEDDGKEIGKVRFYPDGGRVKVKDAADAERFRSESGRHSVAYGVLLMPRIPDTERAIIMAELMARGK